jgi:murein DD-endopeptidase MepM/ murein hydrolase activator NlpD
MAFGTVVPQTIVLTDGKSSFSNVVGMLKRGDIVEILEDLGDSWLKVKDTKTGLTGNTATSNLSLSDAQPTTTAPTEDKSYIVVVNSVGVRIRSGAGAQYPVVGNAPQGETFKVFGEEGEWLKIRYNNADAYLPTHLTQRKDTVADTAGYLADQVDLLNAPLIPKKLIPTEKLTPKTRQAVAANVWNTYGGLLEMLADRLQIPVAAIVGVIGAESSGKAFGADGKMIIRFEVHQFKRFWGEANLAIFDRHFYAEGWKNHKYRTAESEAWGAVHTSQVREWEVLTFARSLDDTAALKSISMGAPQIMGFNFKAIGYESVQEMFEAFARSAHAQILGMFDFVRGGSSVSQAIRALQSGDFLTFASIYNGPGNAQTYEAIIADYVNIFNQLYPTAVEAPVADTQRGPADVPAQPATQAEVQQAQSLPTDAIPTAQPTVVAVTPAQAETVASPTQQVNIRAEASTKATALGKAEKGSALKLLEPIESAIAKMKQPESAAQFLEVEFEGKKAYVAAWLCAPAKMLTQASVDAYINSLPQQNLPAAYEAFWAQRDRLGLPDPFDVLPIQLRTEKELVNLPVNGFGPNTFALRYSAQWYTRIGYMHNGHDFICKLGTPLIAVSDGIIIKNWVFMGNPAEKTVVLWCFLPEKFRDSQGRRMMSNVLVAMGHLSNGSLIAKHGIVKKGDLIGYTGVPAGSTSNDHLHYEIHMINGEPNLPNQRTNKMLTEYPGEQNGGNNTPWNPILFYTPRLINYIMYQGQTIGFGKDPEYPNTNLLRQNGSSHLDPLGPFALAYYRYGIPSVWKPQAGGAKYPNGVTTMDTLEEKMKLIPDWKPFETNFLK